MSEIDYGCDIKDTWTLDDKGDFEIVCGLECAEQSIKNDLLTKYGELTLLGHPDHGNKSYWWLNFTDIDIATLHVLIFTEECLNEQPLVENIIELRPDYDSLKDVLNIIIRVELVGGETISVEGFSIFMKDPW